MISSWDRPQAAPPLVIAHRGASSVYPENTIAAFEGAAELGADAVELDVRRTADGTFAVHHDATLGDGRRLVDLAGDELPPHVPRLDGAIDACRGLAVNVEIKNWPADADWDPERRLAVAVTRQVTARDDADRILVSCFDEETITAVHRLAPGLRTALLTGPPIDASALAGLAAAGHVAVHPFDATVTGDFVAAAHDLGLAVNVWTVDDPDRMATLAGWGVDGICTNRPDVARSVLDRTRDA